MITLIDAIASEYGWDDDAIMHKPLNRLLAYFAQIALRSGQQADGPDYEEQELLDDLNGGPDYTE
jgi:hypothetical protein